MGKCNKKIPQKIAQDDEERVASVIVGVDESNHRDQAKVPFRDSIHILVSGILMGKCLPVLRPFRNSELPGRDRINSYYHQIMIKIGGRFRLVASYHQSIPLQLSY